MAKRQSILSPWSSQWGTFSNNIFNDSSEVTTTSAYLCYRVEETKHVTTHTKSYKAWINQTQTSKISLDLKPLTLLTGH